MTAAKNAVRDAVWRSLLAAGVVPADSYGKIPAYEGGERAARRLAGLDFWRRARTIKANPDHAQHDIRLQALRDGKLLYMAVPKMAGSQPFLRLDPAELTDVDTAADKAGAARYGWPVGVDSMAPVDVVIAGSVAVNRSGARIGKGAGYSDLEVALLIEAGLVTDQTVIVTLVHQLQIVTSQIPESDHDFSVDYIITPDEVISCPDPRRPAGLIWDHLTPEKIAAIPALGAAAQRR